MIRSYSRPKELRTASLGTAGKTCSSVHVHSPWRPAVGRGLLAQRLRARAQRGRSQPGQPVCRSRKQLHAVEILFQQAAVLAVRRGGSGLNCVPRPLNVRARPSAFNVASALRTVTADTP